MGDQWRDFDDEWEGLEPERPQGQNWILWLGAAIVVLFLLGICLLGAVLLARQFLSRTESAEPLVVPTSPLFQPTAALLPSPTNLPLAATATLSRPEPPPTPAIGAGNVDAVHLATPPVIDADFSEWPNESTTESGFIVYSAPGWNGSDDLSAVWRLGWDDGYLYIAVTVTDDAHVQTQSGNQIFRGDGLDMQFDTDRATDYRDGLSPDDFQIIFSPGDFAALPPSAFRFQGTGGGRILDAPGGNDVTLAAVPTDLGYNLEAAIPWSDLGLVPSTGLVIGLALNANDNDTPGTAVQEVMKSHVSGRTLTNPTTWGTLTLR